jgi:aminoglycoside phosphotransferase (APT) family kinase protein
MSPEGLSIGGARIGRVDGWEAVAASAVPLTGGYGGETYAVSAAGESAVLRIYGRDPARAAVDMSLLRLVRGLLPVPRVLDAKPEATGDGPPYVLTERLPGINLEVFLAEAGDQQRRGVGEQLGELLARLSGMPFLESGAFEGSELTVRPFPPGDLRQWYSANAPALNDRQADRLGRVLDEADDLAAETDRICLVHSDFNPKNLLVDPETATITGLVDWEFAHAGSPYADLGNLLRFCDDPVLAGAALAVVRTQVPGVDDQVVRRARAADLWALIELAGRAGQNPVADAALDLLRATADSADLAAARPALA